MVYVDIVRKKKEIIIMDLSEIASELEIREAIKKELPITNKDKQEVEITI